VSYCREEARGFPKSVTNVFNATGISLFNKIEFMLGIPEHKVALPGKGYDSQNDLFVLAKSGTDLIRITVEGKVSEPFRRINRVSVD